MSKTKKQEAGSNMLRAWRVWLVQVAETDWLTCVPALGMQLTCPSRVVQPFATSPCPAYYQPSPRVVHLVPRRISVGVQLGFVKGKKINGSALQADSVRLACLDEKELGSHLGMTLLFDVKLFALSHANPHMRTLTCKPSHANPQTLSG